ncbi:MAG: class I SAM-dependent methyltransferase [Bacteroidetes bacterium]|nr:class I SAM-dependent methyltransferase [Bacteroidota bacterium]
MYNCHFCQGNNPKQKFIAREMMFGLRDEFEYVECANCGSIQIVEIPSNLAKYYPSNYLSFVLRHENRLKRWLKLKRFEYSYNSKGLIGRIINGLWWAPQIGKLLKATEVKPTDAILDVGSGEGELLFLMQQFGFSNLYGVDPFITANKNTLSGLKIIKGSIHDLFIKYDLIMFNHSLEHVADPKKDLMKAASLLNTNKYVLIRIPVVGGYAWRTYGANWVQLDAPRHLSIPTVAGIRELATLTGFSLDKIIYESWAFQFWGSEQFQNDIPLHDNRSFWFNSRESIFSKKQIKDYKKRAEQLNQNNEGDMACFFLRKL